MSSETYNKLAEYRKNKAKSTKTCAIIESQPKHSNQNSSNLHVRTLNLIFHPLDRFLLKPLGYNLVQFLHNQNVDINHLQVILTIVFISLLGFLLHVKFSLLPPYLVLVAAGLIYIYGFDHGKRKKGKLSAYSVFNPNFERIQGEFNADQIDKNLRSGNMR